MLVHFDNLLKYSYIKIRCYRYFSTSFKFISIISDSVKLHLLGISLGFLLVKYIFGIINSCYSFPSILSIIVSMFDD